ncbi:MBL fold metallo-hydrolase [Vibrio sp. YIC-376]|uniref:MBL fold metallo-hydrolase n=1 Tax=Vibrio sp. YIC-376 TaxID=3136162 RepID=UPI00402A71EB
MSQSETQTVELTYVKTKNLWQRIRKFIKIFISLLAIVSAGIYTYMLQPQFAAPYVKEASYQGKFTDGKFHNIEEVPVSTSSEGALVGFYRFLTDPVVDAVPVTTLPSIKSDLLSLNPNDNVMVWMGHSSYFVQLDGIRYLIDPVFSENTSPVPYTNVAFSGSNVYTADDIPEIDYLLISHDHWDHLDYPTINALKQKIAHIVAPIGVGSYFTQWGFKPNQVTEGDWYDSVSTKAGRIHILPAQHFSGRLLKRNRTLWASFVILSGQHQIYLGGDSGYGEHFKTIAEQFGGFDIAVLETGQYNENWPFIHMMPEEVAQAANDLNAKALLPSHNSKFKLSKHAWYEPLERIAKASQNQDYRLMTPMIGEIVGLDDNNQTFSHWWRQ